VKSKAPKVLLVGENPRGPSCLATRLQERGCHCEYASSGQQAFFSVRNHDLDLVLSPVRLQNASLFSLMELLDRSEATLFYFLVVERGGWWLPAIRNGKRCFGSSAFSPSQFVSALDAVIDEVRFSSIDAGSPAQYFSRKVVTGG